MPTSPGGRALAIIIGGLGGGGLGFYYKETYWAKRKEAERKKLKEELHRLSQERVEKEKMLANNRKTL